MILGIVGGIGSGKSTVTRLLMEEGSVAIDADAVAHQVLETEEARRAIRGRFGEAVFDAQGNVERSKLAELVFRDSKALGALNDIVHPAVQQVIKTEIDAHRRAHPASAPRPAFPAPGGNPPGSTPSSSGILVLDVSLLASSSLAEECDAIVFVDADVERRRERCKARAWAPDELERRESFQPSIEKKRQLATCTIDNSGSVADTRQQVRELLRNIRSNSRGGQIAAESDDDDQWRSEVEENVRPTCTAPPRRP